MKVFFFFTISSFDSPYNVDYFWRLKMKYSKIKASIYGTAVGDALGVPVQFKDRGDRKQQPVTDMVGFGVFHLPAGAWSDDTSMTLCLADSLTQKDAFDCNDVMEKFAEWYIKGKYTPFGKSFDVGHTCGQSIFKWLSEKYEPITWGGNSENNNGNGSLMRISPLPFFIMSKYGPAAYHTEDTFKLIHDVSSLTHAHPISLLGCDIYCAIMHQIIQGAKKEDLLPQALPFIGAYVKNHPEYSEYIKIYDRLFHLSFTDIPETAINSTGYIVDSLEAALWSFLTTQNFHDCVLKAVNLGNDTDTIGAIAGSLAGAYYQELPEEWVNKLQKKKLIDEIITEFELEFKMR